MTGADRRAGARKKGKAPKKERKDRVLQARISTSLYDDLLEKAQSLRVPVSNLVRNILEDSFRMVGNIVGGGMEIASALGGHAGKRELSSAAGWQPLFANRGLTCARCGGRIGKGAQAFLSVGAPSGKNFIVCGNCRGGK